MNHRLAVQFVSGSKGPTEGKPNEATFDGGSPLGWNEVFRMESWWSEVFRMEPGRKPGANGAWLCVMWRLCRHPLNAKQMNLWLELNEGDRINRSTGGRSVDPVG